MKKQLPAYVVLCVIALAAGLLLSVTNALTEKRIEEQNRLAAVAARTAALPGADAFEEIALPEGSALDAAYRGTASGETIGYVAQITVNGYGGKIEVVVGMEPEGAIAAINVGGSAFSETAGLGAKVKDASFTSQFEGLPEKAVLKQNIDSITGATISSAAVVDGVNACRDTLLTLAAADR
ncbi:MAG: FMN-binding protein [Christensenellales bacterium]|jgi:electron transport complex protein RnfG